MYFKTRKYSITYFDFLKEYTNIWWGISENILMIVSPWGQKLDWNDKIYFLIQIKFFKRKFEYYCLKYISSTSDPLYLIWMAAEARTLTYTTKF